MKPFARLVKAFLAVTVSLALLHGTQGCAKQPSAPAQPATSTAKAGGAAPAASSARVVELAVTDDGFQPDSVKVKKGEPLKLVVTRKTDATCATELVLEEHTINAALPLNKPVEIAFTPTKSGELRYGCAMGKMVSGVLMVE